ncbi:glutamate-5-semialdehyde dehydrogenase [Marinococcus sp. PL1-022]|uniref:glutamate-5-semialdehyde dehydrogenase n=1 Tax=Marinococcus sp. PL1-022 TaxID=3095363 RepID=UPI0029C49A52|nr:glutamate-5-semialdehyde dehydrogenase [Marinococcus sp. PL1-022]MDX6152368.1 glutamate-5-semialdehyde dehydrogenase [Marinococcus sp. PL1-022]
MEQTQISTQMRVQGEAAKKASKRVASASTEEKNKALLLIADELETREAFILEANAQDLEAGRKNGLSSALLDRLTLDSGRIAGMADGCRQIASLEDPIGETIESWTRPNGLKLESIRVPLGVIGMIYEARPNVTADAAALALKTGNGVLLRGSSSAFQSNQAVMDAIWEALAKTSLPKEAVQLASDTSREAATTMFQMNDFLDVLIPRGGANLIKTVVNQSTVPVLETGVGNCHIFIDETAEADKAVQIAVNAKTQRPSVCNAAETILVHQSWLETHGESLVHALLAHGVTIRGDAPVQKLHGDVEPAADEDWNTEYLDMIVAVKTVQDTEEAIEHINTFTTYHSEAIVTESAENKQKFFQQIDAAALYHNASTRFTDGFEFGFGAEIGVSTQKLHARGPMGLKAITSHKYLIHGDGQIK